MRDKFRQDVFNHLSTILERSAGIVLDIRQIDRLRLEANRLADAISDYVEKSAQIKALEVCKLLNEATKAGFAMVEEELKQIKAKLPNEDSSNR